jgi:Kre9/KNH-like N-terminal Ig-like domain
MSHRPLSFVLAITFASCLPLSAATLFVVPAAQPDSVAARLQSLGASDIHRYPALHLIRADIPDSVLPALALDPSIAAIVPAGDNSRWIDTIESGRALDWSDPIRVGSDSFARLIDLIAAQQDVTIFTVGGFPTANTIAATPAIRDLLPLLNGVSHHRHLVLKALAQLGDAQPAFVTDEVSSYRFYRLDSGAGLETALAWDRHFTSGMKPFRRNLATFLYDTAGSPVPADAAAGKLVVKVKLTGEAGVSDVAEPFALAVSRSSLTPAAGPVLTLTCIHSHVALNCKVTNSGDLPAFAAHARFNGFDYPLGVVAPGDSVPLTVPRADAADARQSAIHVEAEAFGEIIRATAVAATSTPPDPPQLLLSCSANASNLVCTVNNPGQVDVGSVSITASGAGGGFFQQTPLGTVAAGSSAQASFPANFLGLIGAIGTADQPVSSNTLAFIALNQPPVQRQPPSCTGEAALADAQPYSGGAANGNITIKTQAGCFTEMWTDNNGVPGLTSLDNETGGTGSRTAGFTMSANAVPDSSTSARGGNFQLKVGNVFFVQRLIPVTQSGLTCNFQPSFSPQPAPMAAGPVTMNMNVAADCEWTVLPPDVLGPLTIQLPSTFFTPGYATGPGAIPGQLSANTTGANRTFSMTAGGQTVTGTQLGSAGSLTILTPRGGEQYVAGKDTITVSWNYSPSTAGATSIGSIFLMSGTTLARSISASLSLPPGSGTLNWPVPADVPAGSYFVRMQSGDSNIPAADSGPVKIEIPPIPELTVTTPKSGDSVEQGSTVTIGFTVVHKSGQATIQLVDSAGTPVGNPIATNVAYTDGVAATYRWAVPAKQAPGAYKVRVSDGVTGDSGAFNIVTKKDLTIVTPPPPTPPKPIVFTLGDNVKITWNSNGFDSEAKLDALLLRNGSVVKTLSPTGGVLISDKTFLWNTRDTGVSGDNYAIQLKSGSVTSTSANFTIQVLEITWIAPGEITKAAGGNLTFTWTFTQGVDVGASKMTFSFSDPSTGDPAAYYLGAAEITKGTATFTIPKDIVPKTYTVSVSGDGPVPVSKFTGHLGPVNIAYIKLLSPSTTNISLLQIPNKLDIQWTGNVDSVKIDLLDKSKVVKTIKDKQPATGKIVWDILLQDFQQLGAGPHSYEIHVSNSDGSVVSQSAEISLLIPSITIQWPASKNWPITDPQIVTWTVNGQFEGGAALQFTMTDDHNKTFPVTSVFVGVGTTKFEITNANNFFSGGTYNFEVVLTGSKYKDIAGTLINSTETIKVDRKK